MSLSKPLGFFLAAAMAILGAAAILFTTGPASAQGRKDTCEDYARDAMRQSEANERRNCGFSGPRWSGNQTAHFAWCMLSPRQAEEEKRAREDQLRGCRDDRREERRGDRRDDRGGGDRVGKRAHCDTYSKIAEVQAQANQKYDCGFRGGEWVPDAKPHFAWCMRNRRDYMLDEIRFRAGELQQCFNKLGDYDEDGDKDYRRRRF